MDPSLGSKRGSRAAFLLSAQQQQQQPDASNIPTKRSSTTSLFNHLLSKVDGSRKKKQESRLTVPLTSVWTTAAIPLDEQSDELKDTVITNPYSRPLENELIARPTVGIFKPGRGLRLGRQPPKIPPHDAMRRSKAAEDDDSQASSSLPGSLCDYMTDDDASEDINDLQESEVADSGDDAQSEIKVKQLAAKPTTSKKGGRRLTVDETRRVINLRIVEKFSGVSVTSAEGDKLFERWDIWVRCYSKGMYNVSNPPRAPRKMSLSFLPAIIPHLEERRIAACAENSIVANHWTLENASKLCYYACQKFEVEFASLSTFDRDNELFIYETGYGAPSISRKMSIAAHALVSSSVLVVLDTKEDWRFKKNPLVTGPPAVRFLAAVPIIFDNVDLPVGVLTIFGTEAKDETTFSSTRVLSLMKLATWLLEEKKVVSQGEARSLPPSRAPLALPPLTADMDLDLIPAGLQLTTPADKTPPPRNPGIFLPSGRSRPRPTGEETPPKTAESAQNATGMLGSEDSIEEFRKLTDEDCSELFAPSLAGTPSSKVIEYTTPPPPKGDYFKGPGALSISSSRCSREEDQVSIHRPQVLTRPAYNGSKKGGPQYTAPSPTALLTKGLRADCDYACQMLAVQLGYDRAYVIEVRGLKPNLIDDETPAAGEHGGYRMTLLGAHNLEDTLTLNPALHLNGIYEAHPTEWKTERECADEDMRFGLLSSVQVQAGLIKFRTRGVSIGVFRSAKTVRERGIPNSKDREDLKEAIEQLKLIIYKILPPEGRADSKRAGNNPLDPLFSTESDSSPRGAKRNYPPGRASFDSQTSSPLRDRQRGPLFNPRDLPPQIPHATHPLMDPLDRQATRQPSQKESFQENRQQGRQEKRQALYQPPYRHE